MQVSYRAEKVTMSNDEYTQEMGSSPSRGTKLPEVTDVDDFCQSTKS